MTAYDLSINSCGRSQGNPSRGKTTTGFNLSGMDWQDARTVAVDPNIIPLNSKLLIIFEDAKYKKYNGLYTARDTGGAIKGNKIDFYLGDSVGESFMNDFGVVKAKIYIVKDK